jgi:hypothetical protein
MMPEHQNIDRDDAWTRASFLRYAVGGSAVVAGGAAIGTAADSESVAAQSAKRDDEILNLFLKLEYAQEAFYRQAVQTGRLEGPLLEFARTVVKQETRHAALLKRRLGRRADGRPKSDAGDLVRSPETFRDAAIDLEEAAIGAYIGQGANLSPWGLRRIPTMVSVEARQAAWIRDIAGIDPAPRAADRARKAEDVLDELRAKGLLA